MLTIGGFADILFTAAPKVISAKGADTYFYFLHWRNFGFRELAQGNLPLWNPHYACGMPFFGGFQSGLLYPPNLLFLILPTALAINWSVALHVFLVGAFTYLWVRNRGLHPLSCLLSSITIMFGGAYVLHVYAGHLPNLCTMAWAPLLFLALDKILETPSIGACLLGSFAASMALLAGHVQYVFYFACASAFYCLLSLWHAKGNRLQILFCLIAIGIGAALLTSVQLLTGMQEAQEGLRSSGLSYQHASTFSFPPENFLTLIAPWLFGDMQTVPYWGRCFLFEMCAFMSLSALVLAIFSIVCDRGATHWKAVVMVAISVLIALGSRTPLFHFLYDHVPGFSAFRGSSKFIFIGALFLSLLAGMGMNRIIERRRAPQPLIIGILSGALLLSLVAGFFYNTSLWPAVFKALLRTQELYPQAGFPHIAHDDVKFALNAGHHAALSLVPGIFALLTLSVLLLLVRKSSYWALAIVGLAWFELFTFARTSFVSFDSADTKVASINKVLEQHRGDYRIANLTNPNADMSIGACDIWANDPGVSRRYAEFWAATQQLGRTNLTQDLPFLRYDALFAMLRCRYVFTSDNTTTTYSEHTNTLPRLLLIPSCRVLTDTNEILSTLTKADFNPRNEVLLESEPEVRPETGNGLVRLLDSSTDFLSITADVDKPSILLITDAYRHGWRALPLPGSAASHYSVIPANYILRAIPLTAGQHRIRLEYSPLGFRVGKWISIVAAIAFLTVLVGVVRKPFARRLEPLTQGKLSQRPAELIAIVNALIGRFPFAVGAATMFVLVALAYLPAIHGEFIWDDDILLTQNPLIKSAHGLFDIWFTTKPLDYVPLTMTSFWLEWRLWGTDSTGYHVVNILLHALGAVLLWRLLKMLKAPAAWLVAMIFAIHPVCVASVAWIAERKNTLSLVFFLCSVICYLRFIATKKSEDGNQSARGNISDGAYYWASLVAFILALASKPSAIVLPPILLGCVWWIQKRVDWREVLRTAPFFLLAIGSALITLWIQNRARGGGAIHSDPALVRILGGTWAVYFYVLKALLPVHLSMIYPRWEIDPHAVKSWLPAIGLLLVPALCVWKFKTWGKPALFAFGYYIATLLPVLGIFDMYFLLYSRAADHWQYLSLVAPIAVIVGVCYSRLNPPTRIILFSSLLVALFVLTLYQSSQYRTTEGLWRHTVAQNPTAWVAYNNLGYALDDDGKVKEAEEMYLLSLHYNPNYAEAHNNYGQLLQKSGNATEALTHYAAAIRIKPNYADAHSNLGGLLLETNQLGEAEMHLTTALQLRPNLAAAHFNYGILLSRTERQNEALQQFQQALASDPTMVKAYANAGFVLLQQGKLTEAAQFYSALLRLQPNSIDGHYNLGLILAKQGRKADAMIHFLDVVRLRPDFKEAKQQLELLQRDVGEGKSAVRIGGDLSCG